MKFNVIEKILFLSLLLFITLCVVTIRNAAAGFKPYVPREATWSTPDIPQCDKELWLRIKDGCDE